ncbi:hypothetical protein [Inquilinus sp. OTU3971]|uniref:hypothetical protein n=1 Tax=Inquilinus sp. OTU3971 TaxID=3043855 RepID=UPI00313B93CF
MSAIKSVDAFVAALVGNEANASIPPERRIFAPFIGSWDLIVRWYDTAGNVSREQHGEWHFAWVLEGRGIQDVWIVPPLSQRHAGSDYEYGTSIRFYDDGIGAWQSTWIGPMHRVVRTFIARQLEDRVVLETTEGTLPRMRWSFSDIEKDAFRWTNELLDAGVWRVQQTFEAIRSEP